MSSNNDMIIMKVNKMAFSGDTDYGRREIRDNWRERRKTGIISIDTEQDQFVISDAIAIGTSITLIP